MKAPFSRDLPLKLKGMRKMKATFLGAYDSGGIICQVGRCVTTRMSFVFLKDW